VALVDMGVWHWMYEHPDATPAELKAATLQVARDLWNRYYAPAFHRRDVTLLAVYSHMISDMLYLPDYPIGRLIGFQVEEHIRKVARLRRRIRTHDEVRQSVAGSLDEERDRETGQRGCSAAATQRALSGTAKPD